MSLIEITLGFSIVAACVAWYVWVSSKLRPRQVQHGFSGSQAPPRDILLGAAPETKHTISKDYQIKYSRQVYVGIPFELQVTFADPGTLEKMPKLVIRDGHIQFEASEDEPIVKVELVFATGSFETNSASQEKPLQKRDKTVFSFWLKPLKSEDCLLTVAISYVAQEQVEEKVEQIQVSAVQEASGQKMTTTLIKKPAMTQTVYRVLDQVTLNVSVVSFMSLNAWELNFWGRYLGAVISLVLVGISYLTGRNFDVPQALEYVILGVATPLGISVYDGAKGVLAPPAPEKSNKSFPILG